MLCGSSDSLVDHLLKRGWAEQLAAQVLQQAHAGRELGPVGEQAAHRGWVAWAVAIGEGIDAAWTAFVSLRGFEGNLLRRHLHRYWDTTSSATLVAKPKA